MEKYRLHRHELETIERWFSRKIAEGYPQCVNLAAVAIGPLPPYRFGL
jgi:hypothetical protein